MIILGYLSADCRGTFCVLSDRRNEWRVLMTQISGGTEFQIAGPHTLRLRAPRTIALMPLRNPKILDGPVCDTVYCV